MKKQTTFIKRHLSGMGVIALILVSSSCTEQEDAVETLNINEEKSEINSATITSGFTNDFNNWLQANGYSSYNFDRSDIADDCYGGKASSSDQVTMHPVIFIHGNSDKALGDVFTQTGWTASIDYFLSQGYQKRELYAITWGPADPLQSSLQYHSREYLERIRAFIIAVKQYTGASKVDIIGHSMGVTLARKAIKGGLAYDAYGGGSYNLGSALTSSVDTFVGIAGANLGLTTCYYYPGTLTCNDTNGFYPGYLWWGRVRGVSDYLEELNSSSGYEGSYVYTIWSTVDEVIGYGCVVYGSYTTRIPGQDGEKVFNSAPYGHYNSKDLTGYYQLRMVRDHLTN